MPRCRGSWHHTSAEQPTPECSVSEAVAFKSEPGSHRRCFVFFPIYFFLSLAVLHSKRDLSSPIGDWTNARRRGSMESQPLECSEGIFLTKLFTAKNRLCSPSANVHPNSHLPCWPRDNCAPCAATAGRVVFPRKARELTTPWWPAAASGCAPVGTDGEGPDETQRRTHRVTGTLTLVTIR